MGDVVLYEVHFATCKEPIWIRRDQLLKFRPRGYLRQLEQVESSSTHSVDTIIAREVRGTEVYWYIKFLGYPPSDNAWIPAKQVEDWTQREAALRGGLYRLGEATFNKDVIIGITPNTKLIERTNVQINNQ